MCSTLFNLFVFKFSFTQLIKGIRKVDMRHSEDVPSLMSVEFMSAMAASQIREYRDPHCVRYIKMIATSTIVLASFTDSSRFRIFAWAHPSFRDWWKWTHSKREAYFSTSAWLHASAWWESLTLLFLTVLNSITKFDLCTTYARNSINNLLDVHGCTGVVHIPSRTLDLLRRSANHGAQSPSEPPRWWLWV